MATRRTPPSPAALSEKASIGWGDPLVAAPKHRSAGSLATLGPAPIPIRVRPAPIYRVFVEGGTRHLITARVVTLHQKQEAGWAGAGEMLGRRRLHTPFCSLRHRLTLAPDTCPSNPQLPALRTLTCPSKDQSGNSQETAAATTMTKRRAVPGVLRTMNEGFAVVDCGGGAWGTPRERETSWPR